MSSVSVTITFGSTEEAITALAKLRHPDGLPIILTPKDPKLVELAATKEKPKAAATKPTAAPAAAPEPSAPVNAVDISAVNEAIGAALKANKRAEAVSALAVYKAKTAKDLKPEDYADFLKELETQLNPPAGDDLT